MKSKKFKIISVIILSILCLILGIFIIIGFCNPFKTNTVISNGDYSESVLIKNDESFKQKMKFDVDEIIGFQFYADASSNNGIVLNNSILSLKIYDINDKLIFYRDYNCFGSNYTDALLYNEIKNYDKSEFTFEFKILSGDGILLKSEAKDTIKIDVITKQENKYILIILILIFSVLFLLLCVLLIKKKNLSNKLIILYFFNWLLFSFYSLYVLYRYFFRTNNNCILIVALLLLLIINIIFGTFLFKNTKKMELIFLILGIPLMTSYCAYFMPNDGQDGCAHYAGVYGYVTDFSNRSGHIDIPEVVNCDRGFSTINEVFKKITTEYSYNKTKTVTASTYNPVLYFAPSIGISLAKILNLNPYIGWYLGKICNMLMLLLIGYYSIKRTPKFKLLFMFIILAPQNVYQCVTLSVDSLINMSSIFLAAFSLDYYFNNRKISIFNWLLFVFFSFCLVISKYVYFPLILISLLFMKNSIKLEKKSLKIIILLFGILFGILFVLKILFSVVFVGGTTANYLYKTNRLSYVIAHPFNLLYILFNYIIYNANDYILQSVGYRYAWSAGVMPAGYAGMFILLLLLSCCDKNSNTNKIKLFNMIINIVLLFITFCFVVLGLYLFDIRSNPSLYQLYGVQGRYFFPLLIFAYVCISNFISSNIKTKNICFVLYILIYILYIYNLLTFLVH